MKAAALNHKKIKLSIESRLENVSLIGMSMNAICANFFLDNHTVYTLELCVVEAVNNAIKHAYGVTDDNAASNPLKEVEVTVEIHPQHIVFEICDEGKSIPSFAERKDESAKEVLFDPNDIQNLPESGMGLYIIREIMDSVSYETHGRRNTLRMIKKIEKAG